MAATAFTAMTAAFAGLIAWSQHRLSQRQFRHETYERRVPILRAVGELMAAVNAKGFASFDAAIQFRIATLEADFVLGEDALAALRAMEKRAFELAKFQEQLYPESGHEGLPVGPERKEVSEKKGAALTAISEEDWPAVRNALKPYLTIV